MRDLALCTLLLLPQTPWFVPPATKNNQGKQKIITFIEHNGKNECKQFSSINNCLADHGSIRCFLFTRGGYQQRVTAATALVVSSSEKGSSTPLPAAARSTESHRWWICSTWQWIPISYSVEVGMWWHPYVGWVETWCLFERKILLIPHCPVFSSFQLQWSTRTWC